MKVYLGGPFTHFPDLRDIRNDLTQKGIEVLAPHLDLPEGLNDSTATQQQMREEGLKDLNALLAAHIVVLCWPHLSTRGGTMVELGYTLSQGKPIILYCADHQKLNPFMCLPMVWHADSREEIAGVLTLTQTMLARR